MQITSKPIRIRLCENSYFGRAGTTVAVPFEYAEALIADKKATPIAEKKSHPVKKSTIIKGGLDGR